MATKSKAGTNGPFKEFNFEEWLRDELKGFCGKFEYEARGFDFSEFRAHLRSAQREQLLAIRSLIDRALESLDEEEEPQQDKA